ncbi:hypothetical protein EZ428_18595 [Pedobacter frigiditerrae]|uniref:Uncharacterized protein n=1 Tax=Pedobacter frigiditerrae TaxID=2530452 RepID=A0A4R0MQ18_9SPHI|nr:hypothetical protein [Pedobacter frigiditerrae]TCC88647.1 hypothetical protein EZ428_18595 [Pedobacter frigiditerrae]
MKKKILYLLLALCIPMAILFLVQLLNRTKQNNGFERTIRFPQLDLRKTLVLPSTSYIFVHDSDKAITLQNSTDPGEILITDRALSALKVLNLNTSNASSRKASAVGRSSTTLYSIMGRGDQLSAISIVTGRMQHFNLPENGYDQLVPISKTTIIARQSSLKNGLPSRRLTKISYWKALTENNFDLDKQVDAYFSNDGILRNGYNGSLTYSYFYRGQFLCLDTNLRLLYRAKTIDTVSFARIKLKKLTRKTVNGIQSRITQAKPPILVNRNLVLDNGFVFILSALKADNENWSNFNNNQVIDRYSLVNGRYQYSFYIPRYNGIKPQDLSIHGNSIIGIYGNLLVAYTIIFSP